MILSKEKVAEILRMIDAYDTKYACSTHVYFVVPFDYNVPLEILGVKILTSFETNNVDLVFEGGDLENNLLIYKRFKEIRASTRITRINTKIKNWR